VEEGGFKQYSSNKSKVTPFTDTNANGVLDNIDSLVTANTYSIPDTDGDGTADYLDLDSDNDAMFDVDESNLLNGDGDINGDGFGDGLDSDGDGILDLYDNNNSFFGTNARVFATDTDGDGIANYREIDANFDGVKDILTTLYGSFDANLDGKIDGSVDADEDGILDTFDTNPAAYGSPRDLNRKLFLDFDGRNDYGEAPEMLSSLGKATIMCWIKLNAVGQTYTIIGQDNFKLWFDGATNTLLATAVGGVTTSYATPLSANRWYHVCAVYDGSDAAQKLKIYVNGRLENFNNSSTLSGTLAASATKFTIGKSPNSSSQYLNASIDEIRVFNNALTTDQIQKMVYQEIKQNGTAIRGEIVPKDIEASSWANLIAYYRMDAYKDDVIDNYKTAAIDSGLSTSFARIYNNKVISYQLAPMPFVTTQAGAVDAAVSQNNFVFGNDLYTYDWTILQMKHNINLAYNMSNLGLFVNPSVTLNLTNDNKLQNSWYLKLDGKCDLQGKAQLVQTATSDLDPTSAGYIERDQQGTTNKWNYNYWSSPVGGISSTTNNNNYTVASVMKDGTNAANAQSITWTSGLNGSPTSPITLSSYWIFKFQNVTNAYANWATVGPNGSLLPGQGFTLKGSAAATATQNYVFVGKPHNGDITSPIAANNLNLSGNPYASAIDADQFITDNLGSLTGTIYFWEHYPTNNTHVLAAYQGGYATRTLVGGTPPQKPALISNNGSSTRVPGRFIPVGQGFFVAANTTGGTIKFNNGQRAFVKETDTNSNSMFRHDTHVVDETNIFNNNEDQYVEDTYGRLRIGFDSSNQWHRQLLLGFMDDHATPAYDPGYDAIHFDDQPNDMYFVNGSDKLTIQGDGYFDVTKIYPLGVKTTDPGVVSFNLDAKENFAADQQVYIYDSVTAAYHNITNQKFEIDMPAGTVNDRFSLRFTDGTALGTGEVSLANGFFVSYANANSTINIKNNVADSTVKDVTLYNMLGQMISSWTVETQDQQNIVIPVKNLASGTYIVKLKTTKGDISKKIIIK
ncbi:MAG: T9SS type A sorting domain-containing protein, partial [Flavobacterium sp.]